MVKPRTRLRSTLVVALAVHGAVSLWAWRVRWSHDASDAAKHSEIATEIDLDVEPVTPSGETAQESAPGTARPLEAAQQGLATRGARATTGGAGNEAPSAAPVDSSSSGTWSFSPSVTGAPQGSGLLAGGALATAMKAGVGTVVAEDTRQREDFARKHVLPLYGPHDVELGLVPGGVLVTLTDDLVRRSLAPLNGRALLQFDTDAAGVVSSVRVLQASSGGAEWNEVAREVAAAARSKPLKVPAGARGVAVTLEVTSAVKSADGSTPRGNALKKAVGVVMDPIGSAENAVEALGGGKNPARRVVASHIVNVQAF